MGGIFSDACSDPRVTGGTKPRDFHNHKGHEIMIYFSSDTPPLSISPKHQHLKLFALLRTAYRDTDTRRLACGISPQVGVAQSAL